MAVKITKDYAPVVSSGARSGIRMSKCIGVTIHNTDNDGAGANAKAHANLLKNTWKNKQQSWHFAVDEDGAYQSIPTDEVAWHAGDGGTGKGNTQTVAIEICMNSDGDLEKATDNAAELAAQVLKEKGLSADDLYQHHDWSGKNCPSQIRAGKPYSWSTFKDKVASYFNGGSSTKPDTGSDTSKKTISQIADEVIAGKWGNGEAREKALEDAGYDYDAVQAEVNKRYGISSGTSTSTKKTVTSQVVSDVIAGKYGNGSARKTNLEKAGYDYDEVQAAVNKKLGAGSSEKKTVTTKVVNDVINGKYGNGSARKKALEAAGYDYEEVQAAVNKALA